MASAAGNPAAIISWEAVSNAFRSPGMRLAHGRGPPEISAVTVPQSSRASSSWPAPSAVPEAMTKDKSQELSGEGRRRLLNETLNELNDALLALAKLINETPPAIPPGEEGLLALKRVVESATVSVSENLKAVAAVQKDKLDELMEIPDKTRPLLSDLINDLVSGQEDLRRCAWHRRPVPG